MPIIHESRTIVFQDYEDVLLQERFPSNLVKDKTERSRFYNELCSLRAYHALV